MNSDRLQIPHSGAAQVAELRRMANDSESRGSIRIFEINPQPSSFAKEYARQHAELLSLRRNVLRALWIAFVLVSGCFVLAVLNHYRWMLLTLLWLLGTSCVPLLLMVAHDIREAR